MKSSIAFLLVIFIYNITIGKAQSLIDRVKTLPVEYHSFFDLRNALKDADLINIPDHKDIQGTALENVYALTERQLERPLLDVYISDEIPKCNENPSDRELSSTTIYRKMCDSNPEKQADAIDMIELSFHVTMKLLPMLEARIGINQKRFLKIKHSMYAHFFIEVYREVVDRYAILQGLGYSAPKLFPHVAMTFQSRSRGKSSKGNPSFNRVTIAFYTAKKIILTELDPALAFFALKSENPSRALQEKTGILSYEHQSYSKFLDSHNPKLWYLLDIGHLDQQFFDSVSKSAKVVNYKLKAYRTIAFLLRGITEIIEAQSTLFDQSFKQTSEEIFNEIYAEKKEPQTNGQTQRKYFKQASSAKDFLKLAVEYYDDDLEHIAQNNTVLAEALYTPSLFDLSSSMQNSSLLINELISEYVALTLSLHE